MNRTSTLLAIVLSGAVLPLSPHLGAQGPSRSALPATGLDFSGVDRFWRVASLLVMDSEPSGAQWRALLASPGYELARRNIPNLRDDIDLALKPSRHAEYLRASAGGDDHALSLAHIALAYQRRQELQAYRDSLARGAPIADALALAAQYLPPGATRNGAPPLVAFAIFKDDGYSFPEGIVVDLLYARSSSLGGTPLTRNLAHEFHHTFVNRMARHSARGTAAGPDAAVADAFYNMRNEGLADLIDKPFPFHASTPGLTGYAARYDSEYLATPATLHSADVLLRAMARDSLPGDLDMQASMLFWSNGHPNGAYLAREVYEVFGVDSLYPAARDPLALLRTFRWAEQKRGRSDPFSAEAWRELDRLDDRYWK